ncbi:MULTISPECIES: hypothetical protein [unclassified Rhizobium]|uniref:hypothetical protein n=1 Tax=unclassified Rhizobium TaxID=2613769 RepID=UPI003826F57E
MNETQDLIKTLMFTADCIVNSAASERRRIAEAYASAHELVAKIPLRNGSAYPWIIACFEQFDRYRAASDVACSGWMLAALEFRLDEHGLEGWRELRSIVDQLVALLPLPTAIATVH